jgi:hypothetical protein
VDLNPGAAMDFGSFGFLAAEVDEPESKIVGAAPM